MISWFTLMDVYSKFPGNDERFTSNIVNIVDKQHIFNTLISKGLINVVGRTYRLGPNGKSYAVNVYVKSDVTGRLDSGITRYNNIMKQKKGESEKL